MLDNTQQLSSHVEAAISAESQRIQHSIGSIRGTIATSSTLVAEMQQPLVVDMLSPPACCCTAEQRDTKEASVSGRVLVEGVLHGRAMVNKKDTLAAAVEFLKVCARMCLLCCALSAILCCYMLGLMLHECVCGQYKSVKADLQPQVSSQAAKGN